VTKVRVIATGLLPDDSVAIVVDGEPRVMVEPWNAHNTAELRLSSGRHVIALGQVAANCRPNVESLGVVVPVGFQIEFGLRCQGTAELEALEYLLVRDGDVWVGAGSALTWFAKGHSAAWAPDGERIAFADTAGIRAREVGGGGHETLIVPSNDADVTDVAWSPRGNRIAYFWCGGGIFGDDCVHQVRLATEGPRGWSSEMVDDEVWTPAWSPDGNILAAAGYRELRIFDSTGQWLRNLAPGARPSQTFGPAFSPDGRSLAYLIWPVEGAGGQYLRIRDLGTAEDTRVPTPWAGSVWDVTWLPGGQGLVVEGYQAETAQKCLFLTTVTGGPLRPLMPCAPWLSSFRLRP
jgi:hypothetical protein